MAAGFLLNITGPPRSKKVGEAKETAEAGETAEAV
jgi:hypothetical protein